MTASAAPAKCEACHTDPARHGLLTCGPRCAIELARRFRQTIEAMR